MERTTGPISPFERIRHLRQRNPRTVASDVPGPFVSAVFAGDARANLPAERVDVHFHGDAAFADSREIDRDCVEIQTAHQAKRSEGEAVFLPSKSLAPAG